MILKYLTVISVLSGAIVATSAVMTKDAAAGSLRANVCKSYVLPGYGKPRIFKLAARASARQAWSHRVANGSPGPAYAKWSNARQRSFECEKSGAKWRCIAHGRPCLG